MSSVIGAPPASSGTTPHPPLGYYAIEGAHTYLHGPRGKKTLVGSLEFHALMDANSLPPPTTVELIHDHTTTLIENVASCVSSVVIQRLMGRPFDYAEFTEKLTQAKKTAFETTITARLSPSERRERLHEATSRELFRLLTETEEQGHQATLEALRKQAATSPAVTRCAIACYICLSKITHWSYMKTAYLIHYVCTRFFRTCVGVCVRNHVTLISDYKTKMHKEGFSSLKTELIELVLRYVTTLNSAYTNVGLHKRENMTETIQGEVEKRVCSPEVNHNMTSHQLYRGFTRIFLEVGYGKWMGWVLFKLFTLFTQPEIFVDSMVQTVGDSLKDHNGYSHTLNVNLVAQLDAAEQCLRAQTTAPSPPGKPVSQERQQKISSIITQLLEIFYKSECDSPDELASLVNNEGRLGPLRRSAVFLLVSQIMSALVTLSSDMLEDSMTDAQLNEWIFKSLRATNDSFKPAAAVSGAQMETTEKELHDKLQNILRMGINVATAKTACATSESDRCISGSFPFVHPVIIARRALFPVVLGAAKRAPPIPVAHAIATKKILGLINLSTQRHVYRGALHAALLRYVEGMQGSRTA